LYEYAISKQPQTTPQYVPH